MVAARVEAIRELVLGRVAKEWRSYRCQGLFRRLSNELAGFHPPDRIRVTEHQWVGGDCELGEPPSHAWIVDDQGVQPVSPSEPNDGGGTLRGMYFSVFEIRFGISPDGHRLLWEDVLGPRAGIGLEYALSGEGAALQMERVDIVWRS